MRDDFPEGVKSVLGKRVGYLCSNPQCRMLTVGPHSDTKKATSVGVAAHITAASPGGPRYDTRLTPEQRGASENGLWLCQSCSRLIDTDEQRYRGEILREWKITAELDAGDRLNKQLGVSAAAPFCDRYDLEAIKPNGLYEKQIGEGRVRYFLQGAFLHVEHESSPDVIAYYVLDEKGDVVTNKMPYPLEQYSIEVPENMVLSRHVTKLPKGFTQEDVELKWGKRATIVRDRKRRLVHLQTTGVTVNHLHKKYSFQPPEAQH